MAGAAALAAPGGACLLRWLFVASLELVWVRGFCPKGFGGDAFFPAEWQIPKWPADMSVDDAARLRTVTLGGFKIPNLNEEYLEGPTDEFTMQGRETYWQASGEYFMYYCQRFRKWRIAAISAFGQNMEGQCYAFCSDRLPDRDITNTSLIKNWIEVEDGKWVERLAAGVVELGRLGDQMGLEAADEAAEEACDSDAGDADDPLKPRKERTSNCPVMPAVRQAGKKAADFAKAAGKWVQRLFPSYLPAPDEEDAIPEDDSSDKDDGDAPEFACDVVTHEGCGFKEKFYIKKQSVLTAPERRVELDRLSRMRRAVMKPEQQAWLQTRIQLLEALVRRDDEL